MIADRISVIMPAWGAERLMPRVLAPLMGMLSRGEVAEVIVVDDVSPDRTAEVARGLGARVLTMPKNGGPGAARNFAAEHAVGDVLWFIDSDVIAWPDGAVKVAAAFADPGIGAVFGSYDDTPDGTPWFSRYKNLTHRFYHQTARRDAQTFWAGCGAVRKEVFHKAGGFDTDTYRVPSIEDIELGYRIRATGAMIAVDPTLLGKHLKVWTPRNAIFTDIFRRALPWSRLMISREGVTNDLNTSNAEKAKAVVLWDLNEVALQSTLEELTGRGSEVTAYLVDVGDLAAVEASAAAVLAEVGAVDVLVNNAGVVRGNQYFWESDSGRDTRLTVAVNTLAPMYVARAFLPGMIAGSGEARLLNLASAAGFTANPRMAVYAASKWAVIGWSDSVRLELKQAGVEHVKVTTVCPYYVNTGMFDGAKSAPLLPILEPAHVVDEAWRAMCAGGSFVVLPRTVMLSEVLKGLVPISVRDFISDNVIGVYHTMDDFTGRR